MEPDLVDRVFQDFTPSKHMFWQHLSGGEIFLKTDIAIEILKRIQKYFHKNIGISTNGFCATDEEKTKSIVQKLVLNGVNGIAISADYYH